VVWKEDFKKSHFQEGVLGKGLRNPPTSPQWQAYSRIEDYELEVSMTAAALKLGILSFSY
jgi:hypothetical protein